MKIHDFALLTLIQALIWSSAVIAKMKFSVIQVAQLYLLSHIIITKDCKSGHVRFKVGISNM